MAKEREERGRPAPRQGVEKGAVGTVSPAETDDAEAAPEYRAVWRCASAPKAAREEAESPAPRAPAAHGAEPGDATGEPE